MSFWALQTTIKLTLQTTMIFIHRGKHSYTHICCTDMKFIMFIDLHINQIDMKFILICLTDIENFMWINICVHVFLNFPKFLTAYFRLLEMKTTNTSLALRDILFSKWWKYFFQWFTLPSDKHTQFSMKIGLKSKRCLGDILTDASTTL